jgi:hypothetical protein
MTELELYKFVDDNCLEYHWIENDIGDDIDVILFVNNEQIEDFKYWLGEGIFDDEGIKCVAKYEYFCFHMLEICEYFGININNVFKK